MAILSWSGTLCTVPLTVMVDGQVGNGSVMLTALSVMLWVTYASRISPPLFRLGSVIVSMTLWLDSGSMVNADSFTV